MLESGGAAVERWMRLSTVCDELHEEFLLGPAGGLPFFGKYERELEPFEPADVVAYHVRTFTLLYVEDFFLSMPRLISRMDTGAWARTFRNAGPRPELRPSELRMEGLADIYFVCKYLRLNAVQFSLELPLSGDDKDRILSKARLCTPLLVLDESDAEDLDGSHYVAPGFLADVAARLRKEGGWQELPNTVEAMNSALALL